MGRLVCAAMQHGERGVPPVVARAVPGSSAFRGEESVSGIEGYFKLFFIT